MLGSILKRKTVISIVMVLLFGLNLASPALGLERSNTIFSSGVIRYSPKVYFGIGGVWPIYDSEVSFEERQAYYTEVLQLVKGLGAKYLRHDVRWDYCMPSRGHWDTWTVTIMLDEILDIAEPMGIELVPVVYATPTWSNAGGETSVPNMDDLKDFVTRLVTNYKDRIHYWQFWNEPTYEFDGTDAQFVELTKTCYETAKAIDPTCKVILAGAAAWGICHDLEDDHSIKYLYAAGIKPYFDILDIHLYSGVGSPDVGDSNYPGGLAAMVQTVVDFLESQGDGDREIWCMEFGYESTDVGLDLQAEYSVRAVGLMEASGKIEKIFYTYLTLGSASPWWGLELVPKTGVTTLGEPKSAYYALQQHFAK